MRSESEIVEFRGSQHGRWVSGLLPITAGLLFAVIGVGVIWSVGAHPAGIGFLVLGLIAVGTGLYFVLAWRRFRVLITPVELISETPGRRSCVALRDVVTLVEGDSEFVVHTEREQVVIPCIAIHSSSQKLAFKEIVGDSILRNDHAHRAGEHSGG